MPYLKYKSIAEVATRLSLLQDHVQLIYERLNYPPEGNSRRLMDVRPYTLGTIQSETAINVMILNILVAVNDGVIPVEKFRQIIGLNVPTISLEYATTKMSDYLRLTYVTMHQFRVENMIVNILSALDKTKVNRSFYRNAKALLNLLEIEDGDRQLNKLMVLQNIRNSLHSNGVHNNDDMGITIDDCPFLFVKGDLIKCAGWEHIIIACEASLMVIERILNHPKVRVINGLISTSYFEQF